MGYIRDGFNPRGAEYGATERAADAAQNTQQAMDDMLELAMAPNERARQQIAQQIHARRAAQARHAGAGRIIKYALAALIGALCIIVWQLGDDSSAISGAYRALIATPSHRVPDDANAPARAVRAPDAIGSDDADEAHDRGVQVLRDAGLNDQQIFGNTR